MRSMVTVDHEQINSFEKCISRVLLPMTNYPNSAKKHEILLHVGLAMPQTSPNKSFKYVSAASWLHRTQLRCAA